MIIQQCDTVTLLTWMQTCPAYRTVATTEFRLRFLALIHTFFGDYSGNFTRELQNRRGIISGSVALLFLLWTSSSWQPGDMDIYIARNEYQPFLTALETTCQVTYQPRDHSSPKNDYPSLFITNVRRYSTPTGLHIDIIQSASTSPVTPLPNFWTTLVVNFLTPHAAVCAYPHDTLSHHGFVQETRRSISSLRARNKYERRGFTFTVVNDPTDPTNGDTETHFAPRDILVLDFRMQLRTEPLALPIKRSVNGWVAKFSLPPTTSSTLLLTRLWPTSPPLLSAHCM